MKNGFSPRKEITNHEKLFGRKELFEQLISLANNRYSVSITGMRRFGKTSLLNCIENSLRSNSESKVYPIFFDFKDVGSIIKGTDNVYKYMVSRLVSRLFVDGHFKGELEFKKIKIIAIGEWMDIYESLSAVNSVRIQGVFEDIILFFSEYLNKTILFLIDEYEWLFRFSFDEPVGFMKLRNISTKTISTGISPFSFWIAGAITWDCLCTITGSPELNVIDAPPIYLGPIEHKSFQEMWTEEVKLTENCSELLRNSGEFAFRATGGVPFYGKLIGSHLIVTNTLPTHTIFKPFFQELIDSLQIEEKLILYELAKLSRNYKNSKYISELQEKGLIIKNGGCFEIRIEFLKEFLNSSHSEINSTTDIPIPESQSITDKITLLITSINQTHKNKGNSYIFAPVVDEAALIKDLRTPCYSLDLFSDFASSLYKIIFERTKQNKNGSDIPKAKLPQAFKKNNQFIEIVDMLRHSLGGGHLMDTFSQRPGQLSKPDMLQILVGSKNEPNTSEDFYSLQIAVLKMFNTELQKLNVIVRAL